MPLLFFNEINSTNDFVRENLNIFQDNFSGVYSFNQSMGKGLRGGQWISEPDKNIALTFCLTDSSIINSRLSFWVPLVVCEFIRTITDTPAFIKWPNDILIYKKKICGILIEQVGNTFVIGIGINVLQKKFEDLTRASSLILLSPKKYILNDLVDSLMQSFKENFHLLHNETVLREKYNSYLFGKNKVMTFKIDNLKLNGIIRKVDENGLLKIEFENSIIRKFRMKEIEFLY